MMNWSTLQQLDWATPWWGLLALQPVLMGLLLKLRRNQIMHYADAHLLGWVVRGGLQGGQGRWNKVVNLLAWFLLACAAAGPRLPLLSGSEQQAEQRHEIDIMVLLDVSPSMQAQDISPQRLQRAKLELLDLLPRLHGERLGLIAFSGNAGLIMPLSRDYAALRYYLNIAEPALFDTPGTAIASALELALRQMAENKMPGNKMPEKVEGEKTAHRAILLLTDAETSALSGAAGSALWAAADKLKEAEVKLYILGVATAAGATIPQANGGSIVDEGTEVVSRLDQAGFSDLAKKTNGKFAVVEDGEGDWRTLYDNGLLTLPGSNQRAENVQAWNVLYAQFLLPAMLLFLIIYFPLKLKKQPHIPVVLLFIFALVLFEASLNFAYANETEAYIAYRDKNYSLAQSLYADVPGYAARMGEGAVAYRRKDFQYAIKQFSAALLEARDEKQREQALFNLGNSYFMADGFRAAADAFLGVLRFDKHNQDARANLALAAGKLAEIRKPGKKTQGILGRRGRDIGGALGADTNDQPLAMEQSDDKKDQKLGAAGEPLQADQARLRLSGEQADSLASSSQYDGDNRYRVALKKLELTSDKPASLHKALIKIEAARDYTPPLEMMPW